MSLTTEVKYSAQLINHSGPHFLSTSSFCPACQASATQKLENLLAILKDLGKGYRVFQSGTKGYHVYFTNRDGDFQIISKKEMEEYVRRFIPYVDPFLSKSTGFFDEHRIFKIPGTVDASTGLIVGSNDHQIRFEDCLTEA